MWLNDLHRKTREWHIWSPAVVTWREPCRSASHLGRTPWNIKTIISLHKTYLQRIVLRHILIKLLIRVYTNIEEIIVLLLRSKSFYLVGKIESLIGGQSKTFIGSYFFQCTRVVQKVAIYIFTIATACITPSLLFSTYSTKLSSKMTKTMNVSVWNLYGLSKFQLILSKQYKIGWINKNIYIKYALIMITYYDTLIMIIEV